MPTINNVREFCQHYMLTLGLKLNVIVLYCVGLASVRGHLHRLGSTPDGLILHDSCTCGKAFGKRSPCHVQVRKPSSLCDLRQLSIAFYRPRPATTAEGHEHRARPAGAQEAPFCVAPVPVRVAGSARGGLRALSAWADGRRTRPSSCPGRS